MHGCHQMKRHVIHYNYEGNLCLLIDKAQLSRYKL